MRLNIKGMDARRAAKPMVAPLASGATPQTPFCVQTPSFGFCCHGAGHALRAWRCCSPLVWMAKLRGSCLALRAMHGRRTSVRSEEYTSELQSQFHLVCRLLLEKICKKPLLTTLLLMSLVKLGRSPKI